MTAAKLRVQKEREERAEQEPDVEPEVELEEPAAAELSPVSEAFLRSLPEEWHEECRAWPAESLAKGALDYAKNRKEAAELQAQTEADWAAGVGEGPARAPRAPRGRHTGCVSSSRRPRARMVVCACVRTALAGRGTFRPWGRRW